MKLRYLPGVVTLEFDEAKCTGCARCSEVCPHGVFAMEGGRARLMDRDACIECGACRKNCASEAISVRPGVGCASAVIGALGKRKDTGCCGDSSGGTCC